MLEVLIRQPIKGNAKQLPDWNRFIQVIKERMKYRSKQFDLSSEQQSGAVRLLRSVLLDVDLKYFLTLPDDFARYLESTNYMDSIDHKIDTVIRRHPFKNVFYRGTDNSYTEEVIIRTNYLLPRLDMPLDLSWNDWLTTNHYPVTILSSTSISPPEVIIGDVIKVPDLPATSVIAINVPLLFNKWIAYLKEYGTDKFAHPDEFIHRYVFSPVTEQLTDLWLLNIMIAVSQDPSDKNIETIKSTYRPYWVFENAFSSGIKDLQRLMNMLISRKCHVWDVTRTNLFLETTIVDKIYQLVNWHHLPDIRQYDYIRLLMEQPYIKLLFNMYSLHSNYMDTDVVMKRLKIHVNLLLKRNIDTTTVGPNTKVVIQDMLKDLAFANSVN